MKLNQAEKLVMTHTIGSKAALEAAKWEGYFFIYWQKNDQQVADAEDEPAGNNWLYLVPPYRSFLPDKNFKNGHLVAFSREVLSFEVQEFSMDVYQLFRTQDYLEKLYLNAETAKELDDIFNILQHEAAKQDANILLVRTILKAFLLKLIGYQNGKFTPPHLNEKRVQVFLSLLEQNFVTERNVSFYAQSLNVSPKRLNQILKKKFGKTINQIIMLRLVREAKHQLFISEKTIKEIAFDLGFEDKSYFTRFFKKMTGLTPETYKKQVNRELF